MRFIWSATFAAALGGALVPAPAYPQVRSRSPRAGTTLAVQPGRSISDVTGKPFNSAIDALAWTHLPIVQTESVTTSVARGVVVAQRPRAGTQTVCEFP